MKLTKEKLKQIIKEELTDLGEAEDDYSYPYDWKIEYSEDGKVWAIDYDIDNLNQRMEREIDPAKLIAAIQSGDLDVEKIKGPPAGSMPWSQSPANPKNR